MAGQRYRLRRKDYLPALEYLDKFLTKSEFWADIYDDGEKMRSATFALYVGGEKDKMILPTFPGKKYPEKKRIAALEDLNRFCDNHLDDRQFKRMRASIRKRREREAKKEKGESDVRVYVGSEVHARLKAYAKRNDITLKDALETIVTAAEMEAKGEEDRGEMIDIALTRHLDKDIKKDNAILRRTATNVGLLLSKAEYSIVLTDLDKKKVQEVRELIIAIANRRDFFVERRFATTVYEAPRKMG